MSGRDQLLPVHPWTFDAPVADCFEDMLARSVPDLAGMRRVLLELVEQQAPAAPLVVDLGCSLGAMLARVQEVRPSAQCVGVDSSAAMVEEARRRLDRSPTSVQRLDLAVDYPDLPRPADITLAVLTLMFLSLQERALVLRHAREQTRPGGMLLVAEKVKAGSPRLDAALVRAHHSRKADAGYSAEQIEAKRRAIVGVLRPVPAGRTEVMLRDAGFQQVECVWRCLNFAAWAAL